MTCVRILHEGSVQDHSFCETWPWQETLATSTETKFETFESERCMVEKSNSSDSVAEERFHSWKHYGLEHAHVTFPNVTHSSSSQGSGG